MVHKKGRKRRKRIRTDNSPPQTLFSSIQEISIDARSARPFTVFQVSSEQ